MSPELTEEWTGLRPFERRVLRLAGDGMAPGEIAERFCRSPDFIGRVIDLTRLPGRAATDNHETLRPLERCILGWLDRGETHADIAPRLRRSREFVERVEGLARYKLSLG